MREIHSLQELTSFLNSENSLKDTVVQSVDVTPISDSVIDATIDNTVFLGCALPDDVLASVVARGGVCLLYTSPSPRDQRGPRMPSSA